MAYIESRTLFEVSEIIEFEEESLSIKLKNIKYCVLDYGDELCSQIPSSISHEVSEYTFTWVDFEHLQNLETPTDIQFHDEKLVIDGIDWDDPELPKEVIENLGPIDFVELGSDLEESYEHLDSIDYADFPKSLLPIIKRAIEEYRNYKTEQKI
ncbi:hypothetical protein [Candidatus Puniceispirillum marinum]|uniref:Uncharacterized protein n=1 Tax=Puniceispirillum marinum (strain IMCC1322) TaxID=488538 RepID=D5BTC2_PUNMI|nr:hypothetical protein [Candidatus Puniceispirillum marinum]ADE39519.1 hypothetical protein SAR116_1276 [Candidatus Puniceispirillum marinum IMCC1322]